MSSVYRSQIDRGSTVAVITADACKRVASVGTRSRRNRLLRMHVFCLETHLWIAAPRGALNAHWHTPQSASHQAHRVYPSPLPAHCCRDPWNNLLCLRAVCGQLSAGRTPGRMSRDYTRRCCGRPRDVSTCLIGRTVRESRAQQCGL